MKHARSVDGDRAQPDSYLTQDKEVLSYRKTVGILGTLLPDPDRRGLPPIGHGSPRHFFQRAVDARLMARFPLTYNPFIKAKGRRSKETQGILEWQIHLRQIRNFSNI